MASTSEMFNEIDEKMKAESDRFKSEVDGTYKFVLTGDDGGTWIVDAKEDVGAREEDGDADCTLTMDADDFKGIFDGSVDGMQAFMMGKIQVDGDMGLAMKLQTVLSD